MTATTQQKTGPDLRALAARLVLTSGVVLAAVLWLATAAPAQETAQADDDALKMRPPGLDPWTGRAEQAPQWDPGNPPPRLEPRAKRHREYIQAGVPVEYRSQRSPYPNAQMAIDDGARVYSANCKACHGPRGRGDGDAGLDLVPSPALLSHMMDQQGRVDEYLFWSIAEGGAPFDTAMPAFKDRLSDDQVWQVIAYMRAGFPQETP